MVDIESNVPEEHRLRQVDAVLDPGFVREELSDCYAPARGRPSIDPELAVRMMILGVLFDLSDRQLCDENRMYADALCAIAGLLGYSSTRWRLHSQP